MVSTGMGSTYVAPLIIATVVATRTAARSTSSRRTLRANRKGRWRLLLIDEILHHLGTLNYCNSLDSRDWRWCKIPSISNMTSVILVFDLFLVPSTVVPFSQSMRLAPSGFKAKHDYNCSPKWTI